MKTQEELFALIDHVLPHDDNEVMQEIGSLLVPQFAFIAEASKLDIPTNVRWDTHHLFWPRNEYSTRLQRNFRSAFQIPINRALHQELHAAIRPPEMPRRSLMLGYLAILDQKSN